MQIRWTAQTNRWRHQLQGASTLELVAELAVTVLGFSGVVAVLGRRASGDWTRLDRTRFRNMISTAAIALVLSLIPLSIQDAGFDDSMIWGWSSGVGAVLHVVVFVPQLRALLHASPWSNPEVSKPAFLYVAFVWLGVPILLGLNATGIGFARTFTPYLSACLLLFGTSVVLFIRLLEAEVGAGRRAV
jgi:hypothetical protein